MSLEKEKEKLKLKLKNQLKNSKVDESSGVEPLKKTIVQILVVVLFSALLELPFDYSLGLLDKDQLEKIQTLLISCFDMAGLFLMVIFILRLREYGNKPEGKMTRHIETKDSELPLALSLFESFKEDELFVNHLKKIIKNMTDDELKIVLKKGDSGTENGLHFIKKLTKKEAESEVDLLKKKRDVLSVEINEIEKNNNLQSNAYEIKND